MLNNSPQLALWGVPVHLHYPYLAPKGWVNRAGISGVLSYSVADVTGRRANG